MAENFGSGVSYVFDDDKYNYDTVIFQKEYPPLDSELNLVQQLQNIINRRSLYHLPSGWLTFRDFYTSSSLSNKFYTQNPSTAIPEYALINGHVIHVTNTGTSEDNSNLINMSDPPSSGSRISGVYLEAWRALLDPNTDTNKPSPETVIDALIDIAVYNENVAWTVGENGLILYTDNGGRSWNAQVIDTKYKLNAVNFANDRIGWVVGDNGYLARTSSAGLKWISVTTNTINNLNGLDSISQTLAWAVGDNGTILKTTNGVTWIALTSGITNDLYDVKFIDSNNGWAVGSDGIVIKTNDGGTSWSVQSSGITEILRSVFFYDLTFGIAVGDNGTVIRTCNGGATWTPTGSFTDNLTDVVLIPDLDEYVNGEEVSSQFTGSNKVCTVTLTPITRGNGLGETTSIPGDVEVTVDGTYVQVDVVDGASGQIVLNQAPAAGSVVKVYYYHKLDASIFKGYTWITGETGTVYRSTDWVTWSATDPLTSYNMNAIGFADKNKGWVVGDFSIIRHTENGSEAVASSVTWVEQLTNVLSRTIQRIYNEGNVGTTIYLTDDSIHPDTNIETTKRVQIQYKIRVIENVDPYEYPESGLGSDIVYGLGPNTSGLYTFENMGPVNGDYGLWRAQCPNTVDGYCWAIPMFFVTRRNSATYDPAVNANGTSVAGITTFRLDQLTATGIVDQDILDTRRKLIVPSLSEVFERSFDGLMNNALATQMGRDPVGGEHYGTQLLQIDRIEGSDDDGGDLLSGLTLQDALDGEIKSKVVVDTHPTVITASLVLPEFIQMDNDIAANFTYHQNPNRYSAKYTSSSAAWNNKPIPGYFTGIGTKDVKFYLASTANTQTEDAGLSAYTITADYVDYSSTSLTLVPSEPKLVKNISSGLSSFYYNGVKESETSGTLLEQWDSGISGYDNYATVYPYVEDDTAMQKRCSPVEEHYYMRITSSDLTTPNKLLFDLSNLRYASQDVLKINNINASFSYKITNMTYTSGNVEITSASGYEFIVDTLIEIIFAATANIGETKNGAAVNFKPSEKAIRNFCRSEVLSSVATIAEAGTQNIDISAIYGLIHGVSVTETPAALQSYICWHNRSGIQTMYEVDISGLGTDTVTLQLPINLVVGDIVTIQTLVLQDEFYYQSTGDGLLIGYNYTPYQSIMDPPSSLTVEPVLRSGNVIISNAGDGGSLYGTNPYENPLIHIPLDDITLIDDQQIYNIEPLRFSNFSIDSGYVKMPGYIPGNLGEELVFTVSDSDQQGRYYYTQCSKEFSYTTEQLMVGSPRKIFMGMLARVKACSDGKLLRGEYVLVIFSRSGYLGLDNITGYLTEDSSIVAVYRLPNKPISRI